MSYTRVSTASEQAHQLLSTCFGASSSPAAGLRAPAGGSAAASALPERPDTEQLRQALQLDAT